MDKQKPVVKTYRSGDLQVIWKPDLCIHSGNCWRGLKSVFDPQRKPWIDLNGSDRDSIIDQVKQCPSGALSYVLGDRHEMGMEVSAPEIQIEIRPDGPLLVNANCTISHPDGTIEQKKEKVFFCRCGSSSNKPYCDGTHRRINFKG